MQSKSTRNWFFLLAALLIVSNSACSRQTADIGSAQAAENVNAAPETREISETLALIEKMPDSTLALNQLSMLYIKKARQTGDFAFNTKAESAVNKALQISPDDVPTRKLQASLLLTFHRFAEALELGNKLQKEYPADSFIYGVLTDANVELGNYEAAVAAAQKMVDLKPNSSSYARVAHLRSLHGDHRGAIEMYTLAARTADPTDREAQSWCIVRLGDELLGNGKYVEAERRYDEALSNFPDYYLAVAGKGKVRAALNDFSAAEKYLTQAQNRVPNPETTVMLGDLYYLMGNKEKAAQQYALMEMVEQKFGMAGDQKLLALFWAGQNIKLVEALDIAQKEYGSRKDIYTADVLAWCLYKNGKLPEAKKMIGEAMRLKTEDARIKYHAGMIENASGNNREAIRLIEEALKLNPAFDLIQAVAAKTALEEMKKNTKV